MGLLWKLKPVVNKANKQINLSVSKKQLPPKVRRLLLKDPSLIKVFKLKFKGYE